MNGRTLVAAVGIALSMLSDFAAAGAVKSQFGKTPDGKSVDAVLLSNRRGMQVRIITLGATIQSLIVPDAAGNPADVALGYSSASQYLTQPQYFGATVGRYANRIAKGVFSLDGHAYRLPLNNGANSLHGGAIGFDKVLWTIEDVRQAPAPTVALRYASPDGDQGYPGRLTVTATYSLREDNALSIIYEAVTDKPTIVNISNHTYFNLAGEGSGGALDQLLMIPASEYLPVDETLIPTGAVRPVQGTAFDFRTPKSINRDIRKGSDPQLLVGKGYDHNWIVDRTIAASPRLMARVSDPRSDRVLELLSNQPGLQFYSGNFLDGTTVGKSGATYRQGDAFALEPQLFPDTPNRPAFGSARLDPGRSYRNEIVYRFSVARKN